MKKERMDSLNDKPAARAGSFPSTRWTLIRGAQSDSESERREALNTLCRTYWYPIYCFARHRGMSPEDAEDTVQEFFVGIHKRETFARASEEKGKLRTWLLTVLEGVINDRLRRASAQKRGKAITFSFDATVAEERYHHEPSHNETPVAIFERTAACALVGDLLEAVCSESKSPDRRKVVESLSPYAIALCSDDERKAIAAKLGLKDGALRVALHRFRAAFEKRLRSRIEELVEDPADVDSEISIIVSALTR